MARSTDDELDPTAADIASEIENEDELATLDDLDDLDADADEAGDEYDGIEPGAEGAYGTGIEGADQIMEDERVRAEGDEITEWADFSDEFGQDDSAAAEQGNRDQDQMVSEGDDPREVEQLAGDTWDVDALGEGEDRLSGR